MSETYLFDNLRLRPVYRLSASIRYCLIILPTLLLVSRLYCPLTRLSALIAAIAAICLSRRLVILLQARQRKIARDQLIMLLEYLSARLNAGTSLERAMQEAPEQLEMMAGRKARLWRLLKQIATRLSAGQSLDQAMGVLSRGLDCPEAAVFCQSLALLRQADASLNVFVRSQLEMNMATRQIVQESVSEQAQRRTEAWLLCAMPPVMAYMMQLSISGNSGGQLAWLPAQLGMLLAFALNSLGLVLILRILSGTGQITVATPKKHAAAQTRRLDKLAIRIWRWIYSRWLPPAYTLPLNQALHSQRLRRAGLHCGLDHAYTEIEAFYLQKTRVFLIATGIMLVFLVSRFWPAVFLPIILTILHDQRLRRSNQQYDDLCRNQFPIWIQSITTLLQSGLSVHRALQISTEVFPAVDPTSDHPLKTILPVIRQIRQRLDLSWSSDMILREQADRCQITEIRAALQLIARYATAGGIHLLELTAMQAAVCRQLQRNSLRRQLDQQSLTLLLPIALQLIAVMLTAAAPAAAALMAGF